MLRRHGRAQDVATLHAAARLLFAESGTGAAKPRRRTARPRCSAPANRGARPGASEQRDGCRTRSATASVKAGSRPISASPSSQRRDWRGRRAPARRAGAAHADTPDYRQVGCGHERRASSGDATSRLGDAGVSILGVKRSRSRPRTGRRASICTGAFVRAGLVLGHGRAARTAPDLVAATAAAREQEDAPLSSSPTGLRDGAHLPGAPARLGLGRGARPVAGT
jgi:hypothetical protein